MTTAENTRISLRRRTVLAAMVSVIGLGVVTRAQASAAIVDLQVIDRETGETAQVWRDGGRLYIAGRPGARYSLRVTNHTPGRVLAVMSVDGVNILTGETAGYGQRGYVFEPYETYDVSGWRKSDTEVAAFTFAPLPRSYAARTGRPHDVGVIGVAAFTERVVAPLAAAPSVAPAPPSQRAFGADEVVVTGSRAPSAAIVPAPAPLAARAAPLAEAIQPSEKLGTGHGAREWSTVTTVPFERATSYPQLISRIDYDSYDNLVASGIIPRPRPAPSRPRPFPSGPDRNGYVPDPR